MALDLQLRAAFARSIRHVDAASETGIDPSHRLLLADRGKKELEAAFRLLHRARAQNNVSGDEHQLRSPELLVLAAEAGVRNGEFNTAREACHEFFLDGGARDQFYCRALFVKAQVVSNSIERDGLVGAEATRRRSRAVGFLIQALDLAVEGGTRYAFLVYNASVHAWNVLRPALRIGRAGNHAAELSKFGDALEAADDPDLRWRCTVLAAVSIALGDAGDAPGASAKADLGFHHADAFAARERQAADAARAVLDEAKERVAVAQALIRRIEENEITPRDDRVESSSDAAKGGGEAPTAPDGEGTPPPLLDTEEKVAAALSAATASRAAAETDSVEGTRKLDPLIKNASEAAALCERAWLLRAHAAADGAAAGSADAKKVSEASQARAAGDHRKGALLLCQQVTSGSLVGDAIRPALKTAAEAVDPVVVRLTEALLGAESKDGTSGGGGGTQTGKETALALTSAPSSGAQSVLVDLGRTMLKVIAADSEGGGSGKGSDTTGAAVVMGRSTVLLAFAKACHARASSSCRKGKVSGAKDTAVAEAADSTSPSGAENEPASSSQSFRIRLEFFGAELAALGAVPSPSSSSSSSSSSAAAASSSSPSGPSSSSGRNGASKVASGPGAGPGDVKLNARRTDALRISNRVEALKRVERALLNCKRLGDPELLQEGCSLAFSIGLPLLGKRHRKHVHRCFTLAAQILQDLESPLARLRAQLHLEVAKCEMDSDFLAKAELHVNKALRQDYGVSDLKTLPPEGPLDGEWDQEPGKEFSEGNMELVLGEESAEIVAARAEALKDELRPLDRFMVPLAHFLRLKTSVDMEPGTAEEKALLLVDQAKEAADPFLRRNLLARAAQQLEIAVQKECRVEVASARRPEPANGLEQPSITSEESHFREAEQAAALFSSPDADGSADIAPSEAPLPSSKRLARLWFDLLELVWDQGHGGEGDTGSQSAQKRSSPQVSGGGGRRSSSPSQDEDRDVRLARKAAVAVLESGPWSPERNRELVVLQTRAQYLLGETYVEELRVADVGDDSGIPGAFSGKSGQNEEEEGGPLVPSASSTTETGSGTGSGVEGGGLDPRTMGVATASCQKAVSTLVADYLDELKRRACGCFVAGMRRAMRAKEPALVESGAVYVHNFHLPVWRKRLHHLVTPELQTALEACIAALEEVDRPDTALLCSIYEAVARVVSGSPAKAEELCLRAITALDRIPGALEGAGVVVKGGGGTGGAKGKGAKKGENSDSKGGAAGGSTAGSRRANVSELKGLVEVRARCQALRAGAGAVTAEGRPLLQALALLTAASSLSIALADDLVEKCSTIMRDYRGTIVEATEAAAQGAAMRPDGADPAEALAASKPAPSHGGDRAKGGGREDKLDVFAWLSGRKGTTLEEDQAELELVGEIWCRLGKERFGRGLKRMAEECCGYVTELLPQTAADRRRVHPRLWRWLAVAEGLWGQAIAAMVAPEYQEKPLQDELRRASLKHLALAAKCATLATSEAVMIDIAKRIWNVALPLTDTAAGRAIIFSSLRGVLKELAKAGVVDGGSVRAQLYVLLFECYSDRSEWKQGLVAVTDALQCIPPEYQRPLWQWRVVFLSRLGITALDGVAKTKESDKVLQGKNWCTLARSSSDPKQQLSAYLKALEVLAERFERVDCLVEMGVWAAGRGLSRAGSDYLHSALDILYDVEEKAVLLPEGGEEAEAGVASTMRSEGLPAGRSSHAGTSRGSSTRGDMKRSTSKRSLQSGHTGRGESRGESRGQQSQGGQSTSAEPDENGFPESLDMGHLETAVRILTMLARGGCLSFEERLDVLMQAHYFLRRMAEMVTETVFWGQCHRLYSEAVPDNKTPFEEWCVSASGTTALAALHSPPAPLQLRDWAYWRPEVKHGDDLFRWMASPPPGRERFVVGSSTVDKAPLLFHHLLDLAEAMESQGLAAHAAAPLAMCELVARLCLGPPRDIPPLSKDAEDARKTSEIPDPKSTKGAKGKEAPPPKSGGGKGGGKLEGKEEPKEEGVERTYVFPALALASLRRARLLLKLGPTCQRAALEAATAAGPLGVPIEEAARRGAEVDRIMRQRDETSQAGSLKPSPLSDSKTAVLKAGGRDTLGVPPGAGGRKDDKNWRGETGAAPRLGNLEDRKMWAALAKEAVLLGECRAATEYLAAAQRHNDAFHDCDNMISCLETQAALCEAQGHPELALPCLLQASALLRRPEAHAATAARWGSLAISLGGVMRKAGIGDAKACQVFQAACDALEGSLIRELGEAEKGEGVAEDGEHAAQSVVDLDAAVAFSRCASILADASAAAGGDSAATSATPRVPTVPQPTGVQADTVFMVANATATTKSIVRPDTCPSTAKMSQNINGRPPDTSNTNSGHGTGGRGPPTLRLLTQAADSLRPLGPHPALASILRHMAREWVSAWKLSTAHARQPPKHPLPSTSQCLSSDAEGVGVENHPEIEGRPSAKDLKTTIYLENAAVCLAEARRVLSAIVISAEPAGDALSLPPVAVRQIDAPGEGHGGEEDSNQSSAGGGGKGKPARKLPGKEKNPGGGNKGGSSGVNPDSLADSKEPSSLSPRPAAVSTPLGRALVMVQLEEACIRALLGRLKREVHSEKKEKEAAATEEGVTPIQRYMEASSPVRHPTLIDMELPQAEQALVLAAMARERSVAYIDQTLSSISEEKVQAVPAKGSRPEITGLVPLAMAWEGSALALVASRAGVFDRAWSPLLRPQRLPTPPPQSELVAGTKGGKGGGGDKQKSAAGGKGKKAAPGENAISDEGVPPPPPMEESFNLGEQARWKLERAIEAAVATKRWDAAGVASFAFGEAVGVEDATAAAGALMFHQSCRARGRLLRLLREALPQSSRYRLSMDRVTAAQGLLRGMHNLDTCDPFVVPPPVDLEALAEGQAGEGMVSNTGEFPLAESSVRFLEAHLESWRRLECIQESPGTSMVLTGLPQGLAVLSLQISPDGTTLYAAGYSALPPPTGDHIAPGGDDAKQPSSGIPPQAAVVWRHEMKPSEMRAVAGLVLRMEAFQGSVKRHCLEKGDEEGALGDLNPVVQEQPSSSSPSVASESPSLKGSSEGEAAVSSNVTGSPVPATATPTGTGAECETELKAICEGMDLILYPLWGEEVEGNVALFLNRCRTEDLSLVLLLDERLEKLPVEACSALHGISRLARDLSLQMLQHRLKAVEATGHDVSNAQMRYVVDPLAEDPGVIPPASKSSNSPRPGTKQPQGKKGAGKNPPPLGDEDNRASEEGGRQSVFKTLRESVGKAKAGGGSGGGAGKGKGGGAGKINVDIWKGVGGDDHVPGIQEWQSLLGGGLSAASGGGPGSGFLYYGLGRCLSKLPSKHLAGLSVNCKAAILIDRGNNEASARLESKQDTLKSQTEVESERPAQTAAFFSLAGCQSVVLNMWPVTLHNNRRIICSLFRGWGEEGLTLGEALGGIRGDEAVKPRSRFCTVLYGLPTLKYVQ